MHPYTLFKEILLLETNFKVCRDAVYYPYYSCLCTFWTCHLYLLLQFLVVFILVGLDFSWKSQIWHLLDTKFYYGRVLRGFVMYYIYGSVWAIPTCRVYQLYDCVKKRWCVFFIMKERSRWSLLQTKLIMPYLPNKIFSVKSTLCISLKVYKKLYITSLWT